LDVVALRADAVATEVDLEPPFAARVVDASAGVLTCQDRVSRRLRVGLVIEEDIARLRRLASRRAHVIATWSAMEAIERVHASAQPVVPGPAE
jgi:hypothetical protein